MIKDPEPPNLSAAIAVLREAVHRMEPKYMSGSEAAELVKTFAEGGPGNWTLVGPDPPE